MKVQSNMEKRTMQSLRSVNLEKSTNDALKYFQEVLKERIIEKLARPISREEKLKHLEKYRQTFNNLHGKLDRIKLDCKLISQASNETQGKTDDKSTRAIKQTNMKNQFRRIQSKYIEVFFEGSFKHYQRIAALNKLPDNFYLIEINEWVKECTGNETESKCC